jgi:ATP-dependent protease HslVU (ClpYQ) peptidase subunit
MSTITIVKKNGCVAIAADTQACFGSRKLPAAHDRHAGKILRVGASFVGMTGWGVQQLVLEHLFASAGDPPRLASKTEIFNVLLTLHQRLKQEYFLSPRSTEEDAFETSQLQLMIANPFGIFGVYSNRSVIEFERFWASGSGSDYALGAMHSVYESACDAIGIAEAGVRAAIEFDDATGAPIESHALQLSASPVEELELLLKL